MAFHRFVDPSYNLGGGSFPGVLYGESYDRANVTSGGVGAGGSAFADNAKVGGPNVGTYWHAFGEDATSNYFNRGMKALSENTDLLDDMLHRDIACPARTSTVASAGQASVAIVGEVWLDTNPATPLADLFSVLDQYDREITDTATATEVTVASISAGGAVGDGFSSVAGVTLQFNIPITAGMATQWRVYYGERSNLAVLPQDALVKIKVRSAEEVDADVETTIKNIKWNPTSANDWLVDPLKNLYNIAYSGLDDLYRLKDVVSFSLPGWYPQAKIQNTAGAGGWFTKDGFGFAGFAAASGSNITTSLGKVEYALGAVWHALCQDSLVSVADNERTSVSSGFVHYGRAGKSWTEQESRQPGLFGLASFSRRSSSGVGAATRRTHLIEGSVFTAGGTDPDYLTCPAGSWFSHGTYGSAIQLRLDVLVFRDASYNYHNLVVVDVDDAMHVWVRYADGTVPTFSGGGGDSLTFVAWLAPILAVSDNAPAINFLRYSDVYTGEMKNNGVVISALPPIEGLVPPINTPCLALYGGDTAATTPVLVWGGHDAAQNGELLTIGTLWADGGADFGSSVADNRIRISMAAGSAPIVDMPGVDPILADPYKLLWRVAIGGGQYARLYAAYSAGGCELIYTKNAVYSVGTASWLHDVTGGGASFGASRTNLGATGNLNTYDNADNAIDPITWLPTNLLMNSAAFFAAADAVDAIIGDAAWYAVHETAASDLTTSVAVARAGYLLEATCSVSLTGMQTAVDADVAIKLMYEVNGGGFSDMDGSIRAASLHTTGDTTTLSTSAMITLPGAGLLTNIIVKPMVKGLGGAGYDYLVKPPGTEALVTAKILKQ